MEFKHIYEKYSRKLTELKAEYNTMEVQLESSNNKMTQLLQEQDLIERTRVALEQVRPLLSASSIKQLESLANTALSTIFDIQGEVTFDVESKRFVINDGEKIVDLADSSGGGLVTALSFTFDLFLLVKNGCRKLLVYDESFYAVSDQYYEDFMAFVRKACADLGVDMLLVSHDARLNISMVDTAYRIDKGHAHKIK